MEIDDSPDAEVQEPASGELSELHDRVIRQIDDVIAAQIVVRAEALQARRFVAIPGAQWEGPWGETFENSIKVEINKTARGHRKIILDYLANRIVPTFRNVGSDADEHTAQTIAGMHRADNYHFKAQQARDNAFREASAGGFGAYRLTTAFADPYDKDNDDQRVNPALLIADADQRVFFDPNSQLYDKSDAQWCAVLIALSPDAFAREYPEAQAVGMPTEIWKPHYEWFAPHQIVIAEYYEKEDVDETLWIYTHKVTQDEQRWWSSDLEPGDHGDLIAQGYEARKQRRKRCRVHKYILSGAEVLEDLGHIAGSEIPVVPVYGNREYIDGMERFTGHVQMAMDPARAYNAQISKLIETSALAPREVPIFIDEQMPPNLADLWARQNVDRHPYALVKALRNESGDIVSAGPVGKIDPPQLSPVTAAILQIAGADIAELTNADDGADEVRSNTSAEAMDIAATRVDAKSGVYIDNMRQSVQREGEIYLSMAGEIYTRPGRVVETMGDDGTDGEETLMEPFTSSTGAFTVRNDLTRGKYKVIADITEATSTLRDRTVRRMLDLAQVAVQAQDMELSAAALRTAVANMDGEGLDEFKAWNRKAMLQIGLAEPTDAEKTEMAQAQANQQQAPDPQALALMGQAKDFLADADLKAAKAKTAEADAVLKLAQAHALGGPERAPSGLQPAPPTPPQSPLDNAQQRAEIDAQNAKTRLTHAQANAIENPEPAAGTP